jgi:hypothetical protein
LPLKPQNKSKSEVIPFSLLQWVRIQRGYVL